MDWQHRWSRLREASWQELAFRARQEFAKRWDALIYPRLPRRAVVMPASAACRGRFFFDPEDVPAIAAEIRENCPNAIHQVLSSADQICRHRFDLLGYRDLDFGDPIDWHRDPVSGKSAPRQPFYRIPFLDFDRVGDIKVTWELNRHQHLVTLARAYCFTGDCRYVEELVAQWYSWRRVNPYPIGVNWASSLEVGFRCLSWLWVRALVGACRSIPAQFWADLDSELCLGGRHIERYLSTYFSPNTHILGEAVALFFLGVLTDFGTSSERWKIRGWEIVIAQAGRQVLPDGLHFEQSTYYHVYALDFLLHARILAQRNGPSIPDSLDGILQRMLEALNLMSAGGVMPSFGDDDGGRLFDPRRNGREHLTDPLATGASLYCRADLEPEGVEPIEESFWLLARCCADNAAEEQKIAEPRPVALVSSGLYLMPYSGTTKGLLTVDAGPHGVHGAAHGHADALSIQFSLAGEDLLIDPGTFVYVDPAGERKRFRGTAAHNTLTVDGRDQAEHGGPFRWRILPEVRLEQWIAGESFALLRASHSGYERLAAPILHRRTLFQLKGEFWVVIDTAEGSGTHDFDLYWHFAPSVEWDRRESTVFAKGHTASVAIVTTERLSSCLSVDPSWHSPVYGQRLPAQALRFHQRCAAPVEFASVLDPTVAPGEAAPVLRAETAEQGISVYGYSRGSRRHLLIFGQRGFRWKWRNLASDAELLYSGTDSRNREVLIAAGVTFASMHDRCLLECGRRLERIEIRGGPDGRVFCSDSGALTRTSLVTSKALDAISSLREPSR